ncbi:MAG TPA: DUF1735 domain-containing protein [Chitinophagaceae bacterium]|nr:DUF1735 domain-containing protein [Chitinophagaceae bacterium]
MKKIISSTLILAALAVSFTGCLKDKGFDNHTYGINDPDTQPPGVGFPKAVASKVTIGVELDPNPQTVNDLVFVNVLAGEPAKTDVNITLVINDALRTNYNLNNSTNILQLPPSEYSVGLSLTIPAGQRFAQIPLILPSTNSLNPNDTYGLGLTISSVDGGYKIADNFKNLFIEVGVKNKYDGVYQLNGVHNRAPYLFPFETEVEMWTTGPASVAMYWPEVSDFGQPIGTAPGAISWYGNAVSPNFTFNPATNEVIGVSLQVGAAVTLGLVTLDATADANPDGPIYNRMDVGPPKKIYVAYQYNGNNLRRFYDTLTFKHAR